MAQRVSAPRHCVFLGLENRCTYTVFLYKNFPPYTVLSSYHEGGGVGAFARIGNVRGTIR